MLGTRTYHLKLPGNKTCTFYLRESDVYTQETQEELYQNSVVAARRLREALKNEPEKIRSLTDIHEILTENDTPIIYSVIHEEIIPGYDELRQEAVQRNLDVIPLREKHRRQKKKQSQNFYLIVSIRHMMAIRSLASVMRTVVVTSQSDGNDGGAQKGQKQSRIRDISRRKWSSYNGDYLRCSLYSAHQHIVPHILTQIAGAMISIVVSSRKGRGNESCRTAIGVQCVCACAGLYHGKRTNIEGVTFRRVGGVTGVLTWDTFSEDFLSEEKNEDDDANTTKPSRIMITASVLSNPDIVSEETERMLNMLNKIKEEEHPLTEANSLDEVFYHWGVV